ncbi:non-ribosomal peptide synthetase [Nostoc sp. UHCC 0870]|uniref:non-ribosomal peptide synthetase n=1 Tax=Nostoc sp. UHCC 0870 TaxID=2914041 RepID=UPI001EDFC29D|nr:amino acid adenylation domain-containing protein [Nostoc sp. UHCC 0870]UKO99561.1 amino acid adenylation domain-containing protein [Nostoc sp. UHCC 0870]
MKTIDTFLYELHQLDVKLWVDGDRLRYRAAKDVLSSEMLIELKDRKTEILSFLQKVSAAKVANLPQIVTISKDGSLPLSFSQERLWLQHQLEPDSPINNMPYIYRLQGKLNLEALEWSQNEIIRRHEILRTTFAIVDGQPMQQIKPEMSLPLNVTDLQKLPPEQIETEAKRLAEEDIRRPFDLDKDPLVRLSLFRLHVDEYILIVNLDRIVCDGTSCDIFFRELVALYQAFCANQSSPLPPLPIQYGDFAHWQRQCLQGDLLKPEIDYWQQKLSGDLFPLPLTTDYPRPPVLSYRGSRSYMMLPPSLSDALNNFSQQEGCTLFMTLMAAFKVLLYRYTGQEDILLSFSHGGRTQVEVEQLIGPFTKTLALRTSLKDSISFRQFLKQVRNAALEADTYQNVPFEKLTDELGKKSRWGRLPLLQVLFALNPPWKGENSLSKIELPELTITSLFGYVYVGETKFDLSLVMRETDQGLRAVFEYNQDLFEGSSIARMLECFQVLLENIATNPDCSLAKLPLLKTEEKQQLLVDCNKTQVDYLTTECLHQLFEVQVKDNPNAIALIVGQQQLTYAELNQRANQLAHYLISLEIKPEILVGICIQPSLEMAVAILAVLKAGAAYTLLDPVDLKNAPISLLLTQNGLPIYDGRVISLDTDWPVIAAHNSKNPITQVTSANHACVMYLPSLTGPTKSIVLNHSNLVGHSLAIDKTWQLTNRDGVLVFAAKHHHAIIESLFPSWISGATAVLQPPNIENSIPEFLELIAQQKITVVNIPTAFWYELVNDLNLSPQPLPNSLRLVMVGGEKVAQTAYQTWVKLFGEQVQWLNGYGSMETTLTATVYSPESATMSINQKTEIPIGKPIANTQIYILDHLLQPLPIGVPGEIYIGGIGVAQGYGNHPELTTKKFIPNPFEESKGKRLYRTGDLGRYLPDGNIEYLGCSDKQAKINGFRVDLGEIEALINQHQAITQVVVTAETTPRHQRLIAYIVPQPEQTINSEDLQSFLAHTLPDHLIPSDFVFLESLPLTANGEVNRRALPNPEVLTPQSSLTYVAPHTPVEQQLAEIWAEVLKLERVGIHDNFFELGGHSLLTVPLVSKIEACFGKKIPLSTILSSPTISQLGEFLAPSPKTISNRDVVVLLRAGDKTPPVFLIHDGDGEILLYRSLAYYLQTGTPVYGVQPYDSDGLPIFHTRIEDIASYYIEQIRQVQPQGPYFLGGLCIGGVLAFEIALQLQKQGQKIEMLALLDSADVEVPKRTDYFTEQRLNRVTTMLKSNTYLKLHEQFIYALKQISQKAVNLTIYESQKLVEQISDRIQLILLSYSLKKDIPLPEFLQSLSVRKVLMWAQKRYVPQGMCVGDLLLFRAMKKTSIFDGTSIDDTPTIELVLDPLLGWGKRVTKEVEVHDVPAGHSSMLQEPYVQLVAEKIQAHINAVRTD